MQNMVFRNNLFLHKISWPKDAAIQDSKPELGDPEFMGKGGVQIRDYIPTNVELLKDKGIAITKIQGDTIGLTIGLQPKYDILGNQIIGKPDLGAIEINK